MEKNWEDVVSQSNISKKKQSSNLPINRGVELILAGGRPPKTQKVKPVGIRFEKIFSFFKREINFTFEFSLHITKKKTSSGGALWK
tara:strand:+ start:167 stop:424 length:258 start_codon:yes stop_codon:yes gene_type:complete